MYGAPPPVGRFFLRRLGQFMARFARHRSFKITFCKIDVYTYICVVKLENALLSTKFSNEAQKATLNILYTAWWLKSITSKELKDFDLTHEQYNVLRILKGKYPDQLCVKDIGRRMIEKSSNVPRIIDRLEIKKLVKRTVSESDKRETLISITKSGLSILESSTSKLSKVHASIQTLTEKEALQLNHLLEKLRENETD
jgi:DNA-binding MarR family transcriptional regulator